MTVLSDTHRILVRLIPSADEFGLLIYVMNKGNGDCGDPSLAGQGQTLSGTFLIVPCARLYIRPRITLVLFSAAYKVLIPHSLSPS